MSKSDSVETFWQAFCARNPAVNRNEPYQVWHFGDDAEMSKELLELVLEGKKTATASLPLEYRNKPEGAPFVGGYSVVTDYAGVPRSVVRTIELRVTPFNEVDARFAYDEGEGDQSLEYWKAVHRAYFSRRCAEANEQPCETMLVYCERFELLFPKSSVGG